MHVLPDPRLFEGHFDRSPVLPGVALLDLAAAECQTHGLASGELRGVRDVRFTQPIGVGDPCDIVFAALDSPGAIRFEACVRGRIAASGVLIFGAVA
jgi:3-hydroxymyristoyl/3-hydroxydecanoyl-(acyl carrier protein) dehydratase